MIGKDGGDGAFGDDESGDQRRSFQTGLEEGSVARGVREDRVGIGMDDEVVDEKESGGAAIVTADAHLLAFPLGDIPSDAVEVEPAERSGFFDNLITRLGVRLRPRRYCLRF